MNTSDLIDKVASENGLSKVAAKSIVDGIFKAITEAAVLGEEINLPGFGKFKVQNRAAREGRNPSTGATVQIAASKKLAFQPSKTVKDSLNA